MSWPSVGRLELGGRLPGNLFPGGRSLGTVDADAPLETLDPGECAPVGLVARRHKHTRDHEFEVEAG